jgi:hypothetical protein
MARGAVDDTDQAIIMGSSITIVLRSAVHSQPPTNNVQQLHHAAPSQIYVNTAPQLSQECCRQTLQMQQ